jgi:hypothetical protein
MERSLFYRRHPRRQSTRAPAPPSRRVRAMAQEFRFEGVRLTVDVELSLRLHVAFKRAPALIALLLVGTVAGAGCRGSNEPATSVSAPSIPTPTNGKTSDAQPASPASVGSPPLSNAPEVVASAASSNAGELPRRSDVRADGVASPQRPRDPDAPPTSHERLAGSKVPAPVVQGSATEGSACGGTGAASTCAPGLSCCRESVPCGKASSGDDRHLPSSPCGARNVCVRAMKCPPSSPMRM